MYLRIEFDDEKPNDKYCLEIIGRESARYGFDTLKWSIVEDDTPRLDQ